MSKVSGRRIVAVYLLLYAVVALTPLLILMGLALLVGSGPASGVVAGIIMASLLRGPQEYLPLLILTALMFHLIVRVHRRQISRRWLWGPALYYGLALTALLVAGPAVDVQRAFFQWRAGEAIGAARSGLPIVSQNGLMAASLAEWMPGTVVYSPRGRITRNYTHDCAGDIKYVLGKYRCFTPKSAPIPAPALHLDMQSADRMHAWDNAPVSVDLVSAGGARRHLGMIYFRNVWRIAPRTVLTPHCLLSHILMGCQHWDASPQAEMVWPNAWRRLPTRDFRPYSILPVLLTTPRTAL